MRDVESDGRRVRVSERRLEACEKCLGFGVCRRHESKCSESKWSESLAKSKWRRCGGQLPSNHIHSHRQPAAQNAGMGR